MASLCPPLLGTHTGVGAGRIDQRHDGHAEPLGQLHQPPGLAIAFRLRHAVVAPDPLLGVPALLLADHHHRPAVETRRTADDRPVIRVHAVAMQLLEVREDRRQVVEAVRALRMAGQLGDLPRGEVREDAGGQYAALGTQARDFLADVDLGVVRHESELVDLGFKLRNRLLEIQKTHGHSAGMAP